LYSLTFYIVFSLFAPAPELFYIKIPSEIYFKVPSFAGELRYFIQGSINPFALKFNMKDPFN